MNVIVRGKNVPVPSRLRNTARRKLGSLERVAGDASWAEVDFFEERNPRIHQRHRCAVVMHRTHQLVTAHAAAAPEAALDLAVEKLRHQVVRRNNR